MEMPLFQTRPGRKGTRDITTWDCDRYGDMPLALLPFMPSERKVIRDLGVQNMSGLAMIDARKFQKMAGFTDPEFRRFKRWLANAAMSKRAPSGPPQEFDLRSVRQLPFFAGPVERAFVPERLHPSFHPDADVDQLNLSFRARKLLNRLGIRTLGQLLLSRADQLRKETNFGETSVEKMRQLVVDFLLLANSPHAPTINYRSFTEMIVSFLRLAFGRKEVGEMIVLRLGWDGGPAQPWTAIAKKYGYTAPRIAQLVKGGLAELHSPRKYMLLDKFWEAAAEANRQSKGDIAATSRALAGHFKWRELPPENVLKQVLELNPEMKISNRD
jgi:hypothetical protein